MRGVGHRLELTQRLPMDGEVAEAWSPPGTLRHPSAFNTPGMVPMMMVDGPGQPWRRAAHRGRERSAAMTNKMWAWLTGPLDIPDEHLMPLPPDPDLASAMTAVADDIAARRNLDFSLKSLGAIDADPRTGSTVELGAYLGEVILRRTPTMVWARTQHGEPGIALGPWFADPFEQADLARSAKPSPSFAEYAANLLTIASAPSVGHGARSVGLHQRASTHWDTMVAPVQRRRRRARRP